MQVGTRAMKTLLQIVHNIGYPQCFNQILSYVHQNRGDNNQTLPLSVRFAEFSKLQYCCQRWCAESIAIRYTESLVDLAPNPAIHEEV